MMKKPMTAPPPTPSRSPMQRAVDAVIARLDAGVPPWRRPWRVEPPRSAATGKPYQGVNRILTATAGHPSVWWLTFDQARQLGGHVRKGERGTPIIRKIVRSGPREDRLEEPNGSNGPERSFFLGWTVFNLAQIDGLPDQVLARFAEPGGGFDSQKARERIFSEMDNPPKESFGGDRAFYRPADDQVVMPLAERFGSADAFYATRFHEWVHASGHPSRLARPGIVNFDAFGSHRYAYEELVAEFGAAMLCGLTSVEPDLQEADLDSFAAYLASWRSVLLKWRAEDPGVLSRAVGEAEQAVRLIAPWAFAEADLPVAAPIAGLVPGESASEPPHALAA